MANDNYKEEITKLKDTIKQKNEYIFHLEKLADAYLQVELLATEELKEADKTIKAREALQEIVNSERRLAEETIKAHEMVEALSVREISHAKNIIFAHESISSLADIEMMHKDLTIQNILNINRKISSILDKDILLDEILNSLMQALAAQRGVLYVSSKKELKPTIFHNLSEDDTKKSCFKFSNTVIDEVKSTKKSKIIIREKINIDKKETRISILCLPMVYEKSLYGILYIDIVSDEYTFKEHDLEIGEIFTSQAAIAIENASLYSNLEQKVEERTYDLNEAMKIIKSDMYLAERIQRQILPKNLSQFDGLKFHIIYEPMSEIGGDIYDISKTKNNKIRIFLADATGHGVQAALVTMLIKSEYERFKNIAEEPCELLELLNSEFYNEYKSLAVFFTCIVVDIDVQNRTLTYASAGHPCQYIIKDKTSVQMLSTGKMSGAVEGSQYNNIVEDFPEGSKVLLFTDGLFEEFNSKMEEYGEERIAEKLNSELKKKGKTKSVANLIEILTKDVDKHRGKEKINDDITILGIE